MVMKWLQVLLLDIQEIKIKRKLQRNAERLSIIHFLQNEKGVRGMKMIKTRKGALRLIFFSPILSWIVSFLYALVGFADAMLPWLLTDISIKIIGVCIFAEQMKDKSE